MRAAIVLGVVLGVATAAKVGRVLRRELREAFLDVARALDEAGALDG